MPRYSGNKHRNWFKTGTGSAKAVWFCRAVARRRRREEIAKQSRRRNRAK